MPGRRPRQRSLLAALTLLALALTATGAGAQTNEGRAGVVVQYGDGQVATACVRFGEPELDGVELLERSGLPVITQAGGVGEAVCKIGPDGCDYPAEGCFCRREGARSIYWAFYTLDQGAWAYASLGAANTPVRDGTVHGWAWGLGDSSTGAVPPVVDLDSICGPAPAPPTAPTTIQAEPSAPAAAPAATTLAETAPPNAQAETAPPAATATPPPAPQGAPWGYLGFAALVIILGAGAAILARRP